MFDPRLLKALVPLAIAIAIFLSGWTVNGWRLGKANVKLKAEIQQYEDSEARHIQNVFDCQMNRALFEEKLDTIVSEIVLIASKKDRMQGAIDAVSSQTLEIAEARAELERLGIEHAAFVNRTADMTTCQTYELVLAAIAGGTHEQ